MEIQRVVDIFFHSRSKQMNVISWRGERVPVVTQYEIQFDGFFQTKISPPLATLPSPPPPFPPYFAFVK